MSEIKKKEEAKIESRRDFLKKVSRWSKVALGTAVGIATIGSIGCPSAYADIYCNGWGQDYTTDSWYCNYTNYGDW
ncbi:MAG: hypothetical protein KAT17_05200 [Candidatus Aminicenantes bacterium]|nr:hypothetical protein [Candidatus Aminicenantes bacterium]